MSTSSIVFVILIIVQTSYVLTLPALEPTTGFSDSIESVTTTFTTMTSNDKVTSSLPETTEATTSFDGTTINTHTTSDDQTSTTTALNEAGKNLPLILGLTLGLGIPASLATIGGLVYYLKIYRPR